MRPAAWVVALLAMGGFPAAADILNFSNLTGTEIQFAGTGSGAQFTMTTTGTPSAGFSITSASLPGVTGLLGSISGTYQYQDSDITSPIPGYETAPVSLASGSGTNVFTILDGGGGTFQATIAWISIYTLGNSGALNSGGTVNLTGFSYNGTNSSLAALALAPGGTLAASFQFSGATSLTGLSALGQVVGTSYSGSLAVPDGGMTLMLLGGALVGVEALRRRLHI